MGLDRSFLSMLEAPVGWQVFAGEDSFGNDQWGTATTIKVFVDTTSQSFGTQDGQGKQDTRITTGSSLISDALGIAVKDRITLPTGAIMQVGAVATGNDEVGQPLYQTVTLTSVTRG